MNNQQHMPITAISPHLFEESNNDGHHCLVMTHVYWTTKLRFAIFNNEILDVETISKDNCCGLGEWLHVKHAHLKMGNHFSYHDCVAKHAAFHIEAGKIATLINSKKYEDARQLFDCTSQFDYAYINAATAFIRLKQEIDIISAQKTSIVTLKKTARRIGLETPQILHFQFPISL
ncbi:MAG: CZB domain-containing protein [Methylococcales bacterium]|nr:CZB domain-containing protein [Methylococcales bacterium]